MSKVIKRIFDVLLILTIIFLVIYLILRLTNQITIYKVKTGSMEDNIHVGDYILILHKKDYKIGDVVTFQTGDGFITHRIVKKSKGNIITKGDANNIEDDKIDQSKIVGKAIMWGGILNIVIDYKYSLVGLLLALYLFSCYFNKEKDTDVLEKVRKGNDNTTEESLQVKIEDKKETKSKKTKKKK